MVDNLRTKIELGQQLLEKKKGGCYLSRALVHKVPSPRRDVNLRGFDIFFSHGTYKYSYFSFAIFQRKIIVPFCRINDYYHRHYRYYFATFYFYFV